MHLPSPLLVSSALAILWSTTTTITSANETDRLPLLAIKSQLHDPLGVTSSWNTSVNLCQWTGVTCGHRHQRVTKLDLRNQRIGGSLSPYVGNLSFLRFIDIADNVFYGEIPNEVGRLSRLETLIIANNSFSGNIPNNLSRCSNLILFYAHKNNLVGEIPAGFGYLLKLEKLSIGFNNLTGQLPAFIGNLSALQVFYIRDTGLHGRIPHSLGQLRNLVYLHLGQNQFSGMVPPSIYNISSLENIYLSLNRFVGTLPLDIGVNLPNLTEFGIAANNFFGSIPDSLSNASNLELIDLSHNLFKGKVSINFGSLKNLSFLSLGSNNLGTGGAENDLDFVTLLTNCSKFEELGLFENQFGGVLPHSIANLSSTTIATIEMRRNQISGPIPRGIGNLVNLYVFALESNQLTGTIPDVIGELTNLQSLYLDRNLLQGTIPSSLGNLTGLVELDLSFNNLIGSLPSSLGNFQGLLKLYISENKLIGTLPHQIFSTTTFIVDLSGNLFSGSFPPEIGNLKNLLYLDISRNRFSGEIPVTLSACTSLEYLNMRDNSFSGSIPLSLRFLKSIKQLDVSRNNLSGQIPKYLENLFFLEYLNLSYNHFDGEVPTQGVFNNKTRFSLLGNQKLCGGIDELHLPSCRSKGSGKLRDRLLKVVVPVIVSCLILSACFIIVYARKMKSARKSSTTLQMEEQFPTLSYRELSKATNEFSSSNIIGQGSYGIVYKGILSETGMLVAVKVLNLVRKGALKSFIAECETLRNIRHRNLVKIITICSSIDFEMANFKALVYEYMENGSLDDWLHKSNDQLEVRNLSLIERLNIAIDVASAIEYLHFHCQPPVVHGDLKPSNVLLDHDMVAHVSDFGLAKFIFAHPPDTPLETASSSTGINGTIGYVAPEYGMGSETSKAGDVYSFGILLLAMFTGRRPTDNMFTEGLTLHEFVKMALPQKVLEIVDPSLLLEVMTNNSKESLIVVFRTGVICSMESPNERMEIREVVAKLCIAKETFLGKGLWCSSSQ